MYSKLFTIMSDSTKSVLKAAAISVAELDKNHWVRFRGDVTES